MTEVAILDSSAIVSLLNTSDRLHGQALHISTAIEKAHINLVLPYEVLAETLNVIGKKISNTAAIRAGHAILSIGAVMPVPPSDLVQKTLAKLGQQKTSVSYIDCLVMQLADHYRTSVIFGFDAVFAANGYHLPES
jgi:predicted nucleic acid-binding protein